ncbi:tyrosine-protein kinase, partial [Vibrio cholerae]|nr:tyrosine-protein kinase [Vibrio cholerae]
SRFELPDFAITLEHQIVVQDAVQGTYLLVRGDGNVILQGVAGELAEPDDYRLFVTGMEAESGFAFNIAKINELDAINDLKQNLSIAEKGKQTGIVELSLTGENPAQIRTLLDNISQNYFLQNVKRNSAEAEKSLSFLQSHLPDIKTDLDSSEDVLNRYRQDNESID